ncbi:hypothetical protein ARTHRO_20183 [Limnospira indica PCC 8005]|uniref:Uncharacterized protein n=1 Tax=Limnospira indica PCC 8005 TaxID=376219 RepID=A0A9P1NYC3_9CYAN|nr:hypothetical protein ARTHRO_20183 [Limnospira indica PCC 8005]
MFTSGAVCWETRMHGLELELEGATSLSTIPNRFLSDDYTCGRGAADSPGRSQK